MGVAGLNLDRALAAGLRSHVAAFFARARVFLREAILAGAMALGGPGPLSPDDVAEVDRQHAAQVRFLDAFEQETATRTPPEIAEPSGLALANPMTAAEFAARAEMYGGAAHTAGQAMNRARILGHAAGLGLPIEERRRHRRPDPEAHACDVCLDQSDRGWVAGGTLLTPGEGCPCLTNCDCFMCFRIDGGPEFLTIHGLRSAA